VCTRFIKKNNKIIKTGTSLTAAISILIRSKDRKGCCDLFELAQNLCNYTNYLEMLKYRGSNVNIITTH